MERKVNVSKSFYGSVDDYAKFQPAAAAACMLAFTCPAIFGVCTILDGCPPTDSPACAKDNPCSSDTPSCSSDSPPPKPSAYGSITIGARTTSSISITLASISRATSYVIVYRPSASSVTKELTTSSLGNKLTGLESGTEYTINYYGRNSSGTGPYMPEGKTASTLQSRPQYFSWSTGLVSTKPSINALKSGSPLPAQLTANGWNTYTSNINGVRRYSGLSNYSFTAAVSGKTTLSSAMVNQAINAIKAMSPPTAPPGSTTPGSTKISAALLNALADSVNSL